MAEGIDKHVDATIGLKGCIKLERGNNLQLLAFNIRQRNTGGKEASIALMVDVVAVVIDVVHGDKKEVVL